MTEERRYMLLTGASRGIGHATVKLFQSKGWRILTVSRQAFSEECAWPSARESHIQADLADLTQVDRLAATVRERLPNGKLHALVNNAGISPKGPKGERLGAATTSFNDWHKVFQVNFFAPIMLARGLLDELKAAKGTIVNVTSIAGSRVHPFAGAAYATSKAALASLTREMAAAEPMTDPFREPAPGLNVEKMRVCAATGDLDTSLCPETTLTWFIPGVSPVAPSGVFRPILIDKASGLRACAPRAAIWDATPTSSPAARGSAWP